MTKFGRDDSIDKAVVGGVSSCRIVKCLLVADVPLIPKEEDKSVPDPP